MMRILDDDQVELIAEFGVEARDGQLTLVLESAGGATPQGHARNEDYVPALRLLMERLRAIRGVITDALVDSQATGKLPPAERRLNLHPRSYPVALADEDDIEAFRLALTSAQGEVGRVAGHKAGNNRKRIRLFLDVPGFDDADAERLAAEFAGHAGSGASPDATHLRRPAGVANVVDFRLIPVEQRFTVSSSYLRSERQVVVVRSESALLESYLHSLGVSERVSRSKSVAGITDAMVADSDGFEIVEAKSTARHQHVRLALGQLLDYAAAMPRPVVRLSALFPDVPATVDLGLLHQYGIDCIHQEGKRFVRKAAPAEHRDHMQSVWNRGHVRSRPGHAS